MFALGQRKHTRPTERTTESAAVAGRAGGAWGMGGGGQARRPSMATAAGFPEPRFSRWSLRRLAHGLEVRGKGEGRGGGGRRYECYTHTTHGL